MGEVAIQPWLREMRPVYYNAGYGVRPVAPGNTGRMDA